MLSIYLQNKYKGKYINALGLGDRVSLVLDKYDILFYADLHYLAKKITINEANLKIVDLMLKHKVVSKKTIEQLIVLDKLDEIKNLDKVLKKY